MKLELKIQEDAFDRAEALAAELRISAPLALGYLMYLWWWTVRVLRPNPDAAPNGIVTGRAAVLRIEAAARYTGPRGKLVEALMNLQLIVRSDRKKMRVKGTEPYAREQRKKEKARERERNRRAAKKLEVAEKKPAKPSLVRKAPSKEALAYWNWMMRERATPEYQERADFPPRCIRNGIVMDREPPRNFGDWFDKLVAERIPDESMNDAWMRYLHDKSFGDRGWPLPVFMSEGVYRPRLTRATA